MTGLPPTRRLGDEYRSRHFCRYGHGRMSIRPGTHPALAECLKWDEEMEAPCGWTRMEDHVPPIPERLDDTRPQGPRLPAEVWTPTTHQDVRLRPREEEQ